MQKISLVGQFVGCRKIYFHIKSLLTFVYFNGGMVKTPALYSKGRRFEQEIFHSNSVLLSFNKPETVLWSIVKIFNIQFNSIPKTNWKWYFVTKIVLTYFDKRYHCLTFLTFQPLFSRPLEHIFLTVAQNFGNKIPFLLLLLMEVLTSVLFSF